MDENHKCVKCNGNTQGYKCDQCGEEAMEHDVNHSCGSEHCLPKCASCNEAQSNCSCG